MRPKGLMWLVAVAVLSGVLTAGCGGGSNSSSTDSPVTGGEGSTRDVSQGSGSNVLATAEEALATNYEGTDGRLPSAPTKPPAKQKIWIIACGLVAEGCKVPAEGAAEAARELGWEANVVDGKVDPAVYNSLIRQAVGAGVDAIVLVSVDCSLTRASLEAAKAAGIKLVGVYALDCGEKYSGGEPLFDTEVVFAGGKSPAEWEGGPLSRSMVEYAIARTEGHVKAILMRENDNATVRIINDGIEAALKDCGSECEMTTVNFTTSDMVSGKLQSKTQTALTQNPEANVVFAGYDGASALGIAAGVEASGRSSEVLVLGGEGLAPNIAMIKEGRGQTFAAGVPARWLGWAAIDELIRNLNGEDPVDEGIGLQSIDSEHNIPSDTPYYDGNVGAGGKPKQDYEANFLELWGKG